MSKQDRGRRASRLRIRASVVKTKIHVVGIRHQEIVHQAEDAGVRVGISSIRGALSQGKASPNTIRAFAVVLKLPPIDFVVDAETHADVLAAIEAAVSIRGRQRIHGKGRTVSPQDPMRCIQDKKNLIRDPGVSRRLIKGIGVPSLFEAVYESVIFTPIDDAHKDQPYVPGMDYNHFLMIGAVLVVNGQEGKSAIGYHRSISHLKGTYKHTRGLSILWATGYEFNLKETLDQDMWNWMRGASESPDEAQDAFIGKKDPALLRLLSHKLNLAPATCSISPLCVITNDQQHSRPRVYTQYVFRIEVTPRGKRRSIDQIMAEIVQEPDQSAAVAYKPDVQSQFVDHNEQANLMDVAAWQRLHSHKHWRRPSGITAERFMVYST